MSEKVRSLSNPVGQNRAKNLLTRLALNEHVPNFMIFYGPTGTGKTTLAEWYSLRTTCEDGHLEPCNKCDICQDNIAGLENKGVSTRIKKINMALINNKSEMKNLVKEIFNLVPLNNGDVFYILEEFQELGSEQSFLLTELDQMPKGVHVIITTTELRKLLPTIRNRADFKVAFQQLNTQECLALIQRLCTRYNVDLDNEDRLFLINSTRHNPREITKVIYNLRTLGDIKKTIRELYSTLDLTICIDFYESLFADFTNFILGLDLIEQTTNLIELWQALRTFTRDMIFAYATDNSGVFTKAEFDRVKRIVANIGTDKLATLFKLVSAKASTEEAIELQLIQMHELANAKVNVSAPVAVAPVEPKIDTSALIKNYEDEEREKTAPVKLNLASISDIIGTSEIYREE